MKKRILSILLCLCMVACMLPTVAFAADTGKAIRLVNTNNPTGGILGYKNNNNSYDYIYMGSYNSSPVKWRVLDDQTNTGATGLFLLSEDLLGSGGHGDVYDVYFDGTSPYSNAWQGSDAQGWCNTFESSNLDSRELAAILSTTKSDEAFTSSTHNASFAASTNILNSDQVFFLSAQEAENGQYGFTDEAARVANYGAYASVWWLRSPFAKFTSSAGAVDGFGRVYDCGVGFVWAARPAFNLNLNSVLFTSAAVGGKPNGGLTAVPEYSGNEWKLTLLDSRRNFAVTEKTVSAAPDDTVTLNYKGATTGKNEYISVILADNNGAQYYGRVAQPTAESGTVEIKIPSDIAPGNYTLKVFSEQYNGDYKTDYASNFTDIALTVEKQVEEQFSLTPGGRYYFDLSAMNIPGTANGDLPDSTLHYVPFTYAGTVDAYKLTSAMATTEEHAEQNKYDHSMFIADYNVTFNVDWNQLNEKQMIFGTPYTSYGVNYTMRAPSAGSQSNNNNGKDDSSTRGIPKSNEWDAILDKANQDWKDNTSGYIKNWSRKYSFGQDNHADASIRAVRGFDSARYWRSYYASYSFLFVGFRPVLEILNADTLDSDGLKVVTLDLNGGKLGGSSDAIHIIVKNGSAFTAPASDGLTRPDGNTGSYFMWLGSDGKLYAPGDSVPADVTKLTAQFALSEQFSLTPGGTYYFDLSAMNIPGTANGGNSDGAVSLPDTSLHYVPFTYVGTIEAYKLTSATATTEEYAQQNKYPHSLFVADYAVTHTISWGGLNDEGLIFGKNYASGGVDYTLRAPSVGSISTGSGDSQRGVPQSNEWDTMLNKNSGYIQNWNKMYSWGQDTSSAAESFRAYRGYNSARFWYYTSSSFRNVYLGFRPVLEVLNPGTLGSDGLKVVTLDLGGGKLGNSSEDIQIIVKNGSKFTAPASGGLTRPDGISADAQLWWADENGNYYKPGDTVPANVSRLSAFYSGFGLFLNRGDGEVEVTPDNYTDIFGDGTASFVLPKGRKLTELGESANLTPKDILEIYSTGKLERYGSVFPNLKLKNADLTSVRLSEKYIGNGRPLFITADGKNTVGNLNEIWRSSNTLSILGDGSLTLNSALTLGRYTQYGGGSVTMTDGLAAYDLTVDSGSLTVTGDTQAITLRNQDLGYLEIGDGARLFTGSSAQDATEAVIPQLSAEMQELYQRYLAGDNTLTNEEFAALNNAFIERVNAISQQLPGKAYVRITGAWDVTYQPGTNGSGNAVTDIKFYYDALTLKGKLFTRTGYTQVGWATTDGGEKVYGFDDVYTKNEALTLYPVWNTNKYTITFDTNGGSEIAPITQDYGTKITTPADPTRKGYTFKGWDKEIPKTMPAENMTVTARWEINRYTITFDPAGGSEIAPITQDYGTNITSPADPTREGYTFIGLDKAIPTTMPAENITVTAQWKDSEKPTGEIKINENSWKAFLNNITFGLFFKDTQTVTINAADNSGETVTVEFLLSDKELTKAELDGMTFTAYTAPFGIDPDNEYIIYVRLTDNAGNTDYICSDGIVLDGTSPVITGIEDGKTYCEAQIVTVDEKYLNTITVNGTEVTLDENNSFTLAPADGEQRIVVTDKAGNTAEMTVTVNDGHTFGEWKSNGDGTHTRQCTADGCTEGIETDNCTDEDKNHICDICGNIISNHEDANQDHVCDLCGKVISNHEDANKDHVCELCGKTISNHEDADKNHICDHCGKVISNHEDANKDHVCDYCGKTISNHEDADKDHICDLCGKVISNHEDANKDHVCELCGKTISNHEDANKDHVCDYCGKVFSNHEDADKDHVCDYCGKVITNHIGGKETCRDKAVCEVCGKSYGKLDPKNHTDLKHFPVKAATEDADGNIEYWYCSGCNKYYSDKDGTKEIAKADTVTAKLPKSPPTGDNSNFMLWIALLFVSGGVLTGVTVFDKRKRHSVK